MNRAFYTIWPCFDLCHLFHYTFAAIKSLWIMSCVNLSPSHARCCFFCCVSLDYECGSMQQLDDGKKSVEKRTPGKTKFAVFSIFFVHAAHIHAESDFLFICVPYSVISFFRSITRVDYSQDFNIHSKSR